MDKREYAKTLLKFRGDPIPLLKFLGPKWIIVKLLIAVLGSAAIFCPHMEVKCGGIFLLGYFLGSVGADLRSHFLAKQRWTLQQTLFDWEKIEALAEENENSSEIT